MKIYRHLVKDHRTLVHTISQRGEYDWLRSALASAHTLCPSPEYGALNFGVETQVSMGAYRPYCKTLYWTCCSTAIFAIFAFSCFHTFRIFTYFTFRTLAYLACFAFSHILHLTYCAHFAIPHSSHFAHLHILRVSRFHIFCIFAFSHFSCFDTHYRAPP